MQHLADLEAEDIRELREKMSRRDKTISEFSLAVQRFLRATPLDGGADSDLIFLTGARIAKAGIWEKIPSAVIGAFLRDVPLPAVALFLESADPDYRSKVINRIEKIRSERATDPLSMNHVFRESNPKQKMTEDIASIWRSKVQAVGVDHIRVVPPPPFLGFPMATSQTNPHTEKNRRK